MTNLGREGLVTPPGGGQKLNLLGYEMFYLVRGENTEGRLSIVEFRFPDGALGPPLHTDDHDETFIVLEGGFKFQVGEAEVRAEAGACVFAPKGLLHTFEPDAGSATRMLTIFSPGGFERYFEEVYALSLQGPVEREQVLPLSLRYGTEYVGPPSWRR